MRGFEYQAHQKWSVFLFFFVTMMGIIFFSQKALAQDWSTFSKNSLADKGNRTSFDHQIKNNPILFLEEKHSEGKKVVFSWQKHDRALENQLHQEEEFLKSQKGAVSTDKKILPDFSILKDDSIVIPKLDFPQKANQMAVFSKIQKQHKTHSFLLSEGNLKSDLAACGGVVSGGAASSLLFSFVRRKLLGDKK